MGPMETRSDPKTALIKHARQRDGVFTAADAYACGLTRRMLQGLDRRGEVARIHRGVYRFAHVAVTALLLVRAALAAAGKAAVASHSSAAMLLGLDHVPIGTPEITVTGAYVPRLKRVRVHSTRDLPSEDRTQARGLACTTGSRTLIDPCPPV